MKLSKKIIIILFIIIIYCPFILSVLSFVSGQRMDTTLNGFFDEVKIPELTMESYINGEYQTDYENWLNKTLMPRAFMTKLYNQIEFSCFDLGNRIVGKNNNIFEDDYVADALALDDFNYAGSENQAELAEYAEKLVNIQNKLKVHDKQLVVYFTASKGSYASEDIPLRYYAQQDESVLRAKDYLIELLNQTSIPYLDSADLIPTLGYPAFYSTGIHWSRPLEQETSKAVMSLLENISGKDFRDIVLTDMQESKEPFWRDTDVYDLLNVFSPYPEVTFYEYETEREFPETYDKARVLLQGGSFALGLRRDFFELYQSDDLTYINYDVYVLDETGYTSFDAWEELDLGSYLDESDFVVIELQEASIVKYSSGFVDYLDEFLDTYTPGQSSQPSYCSNFDAAAKTGLESTKGYWDFEGDYSWAQESNRVTLDNPNISKNGLSIELNIHEYLTEKGAITLNIYDNQTKLDTVTVSEAGPLKLNYDSDCFTADTDIHEIEIFCDASFIPEELGLGDDPRALSLMIHYVGERK